MDRFLADHIACAIHGRDLITLDLRSGNYDLFAGIGDTLALSEDRRRLHSEDPLVLEALAAVEVFGPQTKNAFRPIPPSPIRTALAGPSTRPKMEEAIWMAAGWIDMIGRYHGRSFPNLIAHARRSDVALHRNAEREEVMRSAAVYDQLCIWLPFQGDCLYRCFMLLRRLASAGQAVDWVFGVRTWPFYAHCWLQMGEVCLTDAPDRLASFIPIFAL